MRVLGKGEKEGPTTRETPENSRAESRDADSETKSTDSRLGKEKRDDSSAESETRNQLESEGTEGTGDKKKKKKSAFLRWCKWLLVSSFVLTGGSAAVLYLAFPSAPPETWSPLRSFLIGACDRASDVLARLRFRLSEQIKHEKEDELVWNIFREQSQVRQADKGDGKAAFPLVLPSASSKQQQQQGEDAASPLRGFSLVTDAEFDRTDEALVLFVDHEMQAEKEKENIAALRKKVRDLQDQRNLTKHLKLFYALRYARHRHDEC